MGTLKLVCVTPVEFDVNSCWALILPDFIGYAVWLGNLP